MGAGQVRPDYKIPPEGFDKPLSEAERWTANESHAREERRQSGGLSDAPADDPVNPTGESGKPFRF